VVHLISTLTYLLTYVTDNMTLVNWPLATGCSKRLVQQLVSE